MVFKNTFYITLFCFILHFDWSIEGKIQLRMPESTTQSMTETAEICGKKYGISPDSVNKIVSWDVPQDETFKKFTYCVDFNMGFADNHGHLVTEYFLTMTYNNTREEIKAIFDECNKSTKETPHDTLYFVVDCVVEWIEFTI